MKKLWNWLSGKKTIIGAGLSLTVSVIGWVSPSLLPPDIIAATKDVAALLIGGGLAHKAYKAGLK